MNAGELCANFLGHPIAEIIVLWIIAQILEREDSNRGPYHCWSRERRSPFRIPANPEGRSDREREKNRDKDFGENATRAWSRLVNRDCFSRFALTAQTLQISA